MIFNFVFKQDLSMRNPPCFGIPNLLLSCNISWTASHGRFCTQQCIIHLTTNFLQKKALHYTVLITRCLIDFKTKTLALEINVGSLMNQC